MNEFFRKHGKWMLAILGVVLMFMWVMPTNSGQRREPVRTIGTLAGKKVTNGDLVQAEQDVKALREIAQSRILSPSTDKVAQLLGGTFHLGMQRIDLDGMLGKKSAMSYLLLLKEAQKANFAPSPEAVMQFKMGFVEDEAGMRALADDFRTSVRYMEGLFERFVTVEQFVARAQYAVHVSLPEIEHSMVDLRSTMSAAYVALDAKDIAGAAEPTEEKIRAHFEAYKDVLAPQGEETSAPAAINGHKYPFGYKFPDRVSIEYMTIKYADVRKIAEPKNPGDKLDDQVNAYDEFKADLKAGTVATEPAATEPAATGPPATGPAMKAATTSAPATTSKPATASKPAATSPDEVAKKWKEVRHIYLSRQIDKRALAKVRDLGERVAAKGPAEWTKTGPKGYREEIPRESWVDYAAVAAKLTQETGVPIEVSKFTSGSVSALLSKEEVAGLPGIGKAVFVRASKEKVALADLAVHVYPLDQNQSGVAQQLLLQVGVEGPVVLDEANNAYVYRVVKAEASHVPATEAELKEIRPAVVKDLKRLDVYERQQKRAEVLKADALASSLQKVSETRKVEMKITPPFPRLVRHNTQTGLVEFIPPEIPGVGRVKPFSEAAFELAQSLPAVSFSGAVKRESWDVSNRSAGPAVAVPVDETLTVYVLQLDGYKPVPENQRNAERIQTANELRRIEAQKFLREWIDLKQIAQRVGYKPASGFKLEGD